MIRTFLALELPKDFKKELIQKIREFRSYNSHGIKWVEDQNLHITLQFIGDTKEEQVEEIAEEFNRIFSELSEVHLKNPRLKLIPGRMPRILWVEFDASDQEIFRISRKIRTELQRLGYRLDKRPLKIHATLGRIKKRLSEILIGKILSSDFGEKQIVITRGTYYQSILKQEGPEYNKIASYDFKKGVSKWPTKTKHQP